MRCRPRRGLRCMSRHAQDTAAPAPERGRWPASIPRRVHRASRHRSAGRPDCRSVGRRAQCRRGAGAEQSGTCAGDRCGAWRSAAGAVGHSHGGPAQIPNWATRCVWCERLRRSARCCTCSMRRGRWSARYVSRTTTPTARRHGWWRASAPTSSMSAGSRWRPRRTDGGRGCFGGGRGRHRTGGGPRIAQCRLDQGAACGVSDTVGATLGLCAAADDSDARRIDNAGAYTGAGATGDRRRRARRGRVPGFRCTCRKLCARSAGRCCGLPVCTGGDLGCCTAGPVLRRPSTCWWSSRWRPGPSSSGGMTRACWHRSGASSQHLPRRCCLARLAGRSVRRCLIGSKRPGCRCLRVWNPRWRSGVMRSPKRPYLMSRSTRQRSCRCCGGIQSDWQCRPRRHEWRRLRTNGGFRRPPQLQCRRWAIGHQLPPIFIRTEMGTRPTTRHPPSRG